VSELLKSLRSDLLDRRVLPLVVVLGLAFAGALVYAVLSGASSAKPVAAASPVTPPAPRGAALAVAQAPANPHAAVSETTEGGRYRHREGSHDPFTPLPLPRTRTARTVARATSAATSPASKSTPASSSPSSSGGAGTTPSTPAPAPAAPKPKTVHRIVETASVLFGPAPTTPGQLSQLTPYATVKQGEPLPSADDPVLVFKGLGPDNKSALFTFAREVFPKGPATCQPSASQCESILLPLGGVEELSILEPSGQTVVYELKLEGTDRHSLIARIARRHRGHR
jgi:hypothetical protein